MPSSLQKVADVAKMAGYQKQVDEFVLSMNRAAEAAAPLAASIFGDAIRAMTLDDVRGILTGSDTAATDFFRRKTHDKLYAAFKPVVSKKVDEVGATKAGEPCVAFKQKACRGACVGKEAVSLHSARLMSALAKFKLADWPYQGPVALIERDEFGMREDFHLFDGWRHLATVHDEAALHDALAHRASADQAFDADLYRVVNKFVAAGKVRVLPLF